MTANSDKRRPLTIRVHKTTTGPDDYLCMLDVSSSPALNRTADRWVKRTGADEDLSFGSPRSQRPRMLLTEDPDDPLPEEKAPITASAADAPGRGAGQAKLPADKEWKLSVRLDRELLAELYGAADRLRASRATVSSMVEEALRLYLPRLREHHNGGQPFPQRGPKARSTVRAPMLPTPTPKTNPAEDTGRMDETMSQPIREYIPASTKPAETKPNPALVITTLPAR